MLSACETAALLAKLEGERDPDLRSAREKLKRHHRTQGALARAKQELLRGNVSTFSGGRPMHIPGQLEMGAIDDRTGAKRPAARGAR